MSDGHSPGNGVSQAQVMARIDKMADWAQTIEQRLNGIPDAATLWAEADALTTQYTAVPAEIRELERDKAQKLQALIDLRDKLEIREAQLSLEADGTNAAARKAALTVALATDETAKTLKSQVGDLDFEVKLIDVEIQEKERVWSDYHRKVVILASKAGVSYR